MSSPSACRLEHNGGAAQKPMGGWTGTSRKFAGGGALRISARNGHTELRIPTRSGASNAFSWVEAGPGSPYASTSNVIVPELPSRCSQLQPFDAFVMTFAVVPLISASAALRLKSSYKAMTAVIDIIIINNPSVENALIVPTKSGVFSPKYMMIEMHKKYTFPNLCSCSHKFLGTKLYHSYFEVFTVLDGNVPLVFASHPPLLKISDRSRSIAAQWGTNDTVMNPPR